MINILSIIYSLIYSNLFLRLLFFFSRISDLWQEFLYKIRLQKFLKIVDYIHKDVVNSSLYDSHSDANTQNIVFENSFKSCF